MGDSRRDGGLADGLRCRRRTRILIHQPGGILAECSGDRFPHQTGVRQRRKGERWQIGRVAPAIAARGIRQRRGRLGTVETAGQGVRRVLTHPTMVPRTANPREWETVL